MDDYNDGRWRHLYDNEKQILRKYYEISHKFVHIFFCIPQAIAIIVTIALVSDIIVKWDEYLGNLSQTCAMIFFGMPCLWVMFFFIPKWLKKAIDREVNAIDDDTALVSERTIADKQVTFTGSSASGHPNKGYEVNVFPSANIRRGRYVNCTRYIYDNLNPGQTCYVVFFPRKNDGKMYTAFMYAFTKEFEELKQLADSE